MNWIIVREMLFEATLQLFEGCGSTILDARPTTPSTDTSSTLSVIGFAGKQVRGSLVLCLYPGLLRASYPTKDELTDEDLLAWSGELSNQLLGRLKNKLVARGVSINLSKPTALSGTGMRFGTALPTSELIERAFSYAGEPVLVRLEARASAGVELREPDPVSSSNEGDMILF